MICQPSISEEFISFILFSIIFWRSLKLIYHTQVYMIEDLCFRLGALPLLGSLILQKMMLNPWGKSIILQSKASVNLYKAS